MTKTIDERRESIEQQIRRLKAEKRKLDRAEKAAERKHRDHVMIVVGTHYLTHFPKEIETLLLGLDDNEIRDWVDGHLRKPATREYGGSE